ncbi:hypothetical protein GCM10023189_19500 [Nibrella saemangeumensis]|uniref:Outer membrane protein beta-barrel domain-containing protein n=1 Tax=Nibrella saemangeumensis TaxID=1084526 RepID=A0ABP8MRX1_9BACT
MLLRLFVMAVLCQPANAQLYKSYQKHHLWSATLEIGGINPVLALNAEYSPFQVAGLFTTLRAGIGHTFTDYSINTFPHSVSVNILLNRKQTKCPIPIGEPNQWFLEVGAGGLVFNRPKDKQDYRYTPMLGVRWYQTAKYTLTRYFWKSQFTPLILGRLVPWGGIGMGVIL